MTGFDSKRQAAQDKLDDDADTLTIVYQQGFADGKRAPQRPWQGLTDEDTFEIGERLGLADVAWIDLMKAIEAKLKERNGY